MAVAMADANGEKVAASVARAVAIAAHPIRHAQKVKMAFAPQELPATNLPPKSVKTLLQRAQAQNAESVAHATVMAETAVNVKPNNAQSRMRAMLPLFPMP